MRTVLVNIMIMFFVVCCESVTAFAQQQWMSTDIDYVAKRNWTIFKNVNEYPFVDFRLDTLDTTDYYNCNYYHYFSDTAFPFISPEDSVKCVEYLIWYHDFRNQYREMPIARGPSTLHFFRQYLPYIRNERDTFWTRKLLEGDQTFTFKSLNAEEIRWFIELDAGFMGRIIAKRYWRDTTICLYYRTEYIIEVLDVIHSYFPLQNGDKLFTTNRSSGFAGGCDDNNSIDNYQDNVHREIYMAGDTALFFVNRNQYQSHVMMDKMYHGDLRRRKDYREDKIYCPQKVELSFSEDFYAERKNKIKEFISDIKLFFKTRYYEKQ